MPDLKRAKEILHTLRELLQERVPALIRSRADATAHVALLDEHRDLQRELTGLKEKLGSEGIAKLTHELGSETAGLK